MTDPGNVLRDFVKGRLSSAELVRLLSGYMELHRDAEGRIFVEYSDMSLPPVVFEPEDVRAVINRAISGDIEIEEMSEWAEMITLLDCFNLSIEGDAADQVWDVLHRASHPDLTGLGDRWKLRDLLAAIQSV